MSFRKLNLIRVGTTGAIAVAAFATAALPVQAVIAPLVVNRIGDAVDRNIGDGKCDTSTASGKQCTLRAAIQEANFTTTLDTINFNITSSSKVIAPTSPLPPITQLTTIDGYSQPGTSTNTKSVGNDAVLKIVLDGINAGAGANGLQVGGYKSTVQGLVIQRFKGSGIVLTGSTEKVFGNFIGTNAAGTVARGNDIGVTMGSDSGIVGSNLPRDRNLISGNPSGGVAIPVGAGSGNHVWGNYIGTDKAGTHALANGVGVNVQAPGAMIGNAGAGYGNLISGNGGYGLAINQAVGSNESVVKQNLIGTDASGTTALGNGVGGIIVVANNLTIGGGGAAGRNVVSGNKTFGIVLGTGATEVKIESNYIGTDITGTAALGNVSDGVRLNEASDCIVGGTDANARNVISANGQNGVLIMGATTDNIVEGNYIGTKADGTGDLGNLNIGIFDFSDNQVFGGTGSAGNKIVGGLTSGIYLSVGAIGNLVAGNSIAASEGSGISVNGAPNTIQANSIVQNGEDGITVIGSGDGVEMAANQILANGELGIDIVGGTEGSAGVTANDLDDPDSGANGLQNFPVLSAAVFSTNTHVTTVSASLNSGHSQTFRIELFLSAPDPSGHGEAVALLASKTVTTNSGGDVNFSFQLAGVAPGQILTATATETGHHNTSEFSANVTVVAGP